MTCKLLGGTFAMFLQFMVGVMAYLVLVYKRSVEPSPRRPHRIWMLDISKQGFSSALIHSWNVLSAMMFSNVEVPDENGDECAFYIINYVLDTCFGVFLIWSFLLAASRIAYHTNIPSIQIQGRYDSSSVGTWYFEQLVVFLLAISLSKTILSALEYVWEDTLREISKFLFRQFSLSDDIELVMSLIILPFFMSMIQYWIQDNILMAQERDEGHNYQEIETIDHSESRDEQF